MSSDDASNVAWESSIRGFLYRQLLTYPKALPSSTSLSGQTGIITGANIGLGFEAARQLLHLGVSHLILAVRSKEKGDDAAERLAKQFPDAKISVWIIDMADYKSVTAFAKRCTTLERIDFAILNAGVQLTTFTKSETTGHEMTLQTNYYSTALLALLLIRAIREKQAGKTAERPPVISVVGSDTMYMTKLQASGDVLSELDGSTGYDMFQQYAKSKLLLMMFMSRLAERINPDQVILNVCNPGLTSGTSLMARDSSEAGIAARLFVPIMLRAIGRSLQSGASNYIHAVVAEGRKSHGKFVSDWAIKPYAGIQYTQEGRDMRERLWEQTVDELRSKTGSEFSFI